MTTIEPGAVTLRPTGGIRNAIVTLWALMGAGGLWMIYDALTNHHHELAQAAEGAAVFLFGGALGLGLATTMYVASREYLEFRQFGIVWWKIATADIGVSQSENPYAISVVDTKLNKVRTELNLRLYKAEEFQRFSEFIDESRERIGIDLVDPTEDDDEDSSMASFLKTLVWPIAFMAVVSMGRLGWAAITQHLPVGEILIRAMKVSVVIAALFGAIVLLYVVAGLFERRKRKSE